MTTQLSQQTTLDTIIDFLEHNDFADQTFNQVFKSTQKHSASWLKHPTPDVVLKQMLEDFPGGTEHAQQFVKDFDVASLGHLTVKFTDTYSFVEKVEFYLTQLVWQKIQNDFNGQIFEDTKFDDVKDQFIKTAKKLNLSNGLKDEYL